MPTGNYLTDVLGKEVVPAQGGQAAYLADIQNVIQPTVNIPKTAEQEIDLASFGLQNMEEYQLMVDVKEQGGSSTDFREILEQTRGQKENIVKEKLADSGLSGFNQGVSNVIGGAVSQLPEIVGNVGGFFIGKPIDFLLEKAGVDAPSLEEQFKQDGIEGKKSFQKVLGVDPEAFTTDIGEFGAEIGTLFIPGGQAKLVSKFPQASAKIAKLGETLTTIGEKAPRTFNLLKSALTGASEFAKFDIVTKGDVTKEDLAIGAVANPLIGTTIKGIGMVSKKLADKLELAGLLNPAKLDKVAKQLKSNGIEETSSVADFLLNKNIKGSKEEIVKTLFEDATNSRKAVDKALKSIKTESFDEGTNKGLKIILDNLEGKTGLEDDFIKFTKLQDKLAKKGLNTTEKNQVKRGLDEFINIFKDSGEVIAGTNKLGASNVRKSIQTQIEKEAEEAGIKNLKALNKNTQVSFTLAESIARKDAADQASALINAFAPSGAGAIIGGVGTQGDIYDRLKGAVGGAVLGKVAGSTLVKTNIANLLNKLSPLEKFSLDQFIRTKGGVELSPSIMNKLTSGKSFKTVGATKSAKETFNIKGLKKIGEGTDRKVYDLGDGNVLKVAKNKRGIEQNKGALYTELQDAGIIPKVKEVGPDYVIMEKVPTVNELPIGQTKVLGDFQADMLKLSKELDVGNTKNINSTLKKYGWEALAKEDLTKFGWGDIGLKNLSVKNGKPILIDEGTVELISTIKKFDKIERIKDFIKKVFNK